MEASRLMRKCLSILSSLDSVWDALSNKRAMSVSAWMCSSGCLARNRSTSSSLGVILRAAATLQHDKQVQVLPVNL